ERTADEFRQNDAKALDSEAGVQAEETLIHPDASVHHSLVSKFAIPGAPGKRTLIGGMAIDITERRRAQEAMRESEERFRTMADPAPVLIWVAGPDGRCTYFNKPWLDYTGRSLEEERREGWIDDVHPDDRQRCLETWSGFFAGRRPFSLEFRLRR